MEWTFTLGGRDQEFRLDFEDNAQVLDSAGVLFNNLFASLNLGNTDYSLSMEILSDRPQPDQRFRLVLKLLNRSKTVISGFSVYVWRDGQFSRLELPRETVHPNDLWNRITDQFRAALTQRVTTP